VVVLHERNLEGIEERRSKCTKESWRTKTGG